MNNPDRPRRPLRVTLAAAERAAIVEALERHDFNITRSARFLGVCRRTLQTKVHRLGLRSGKPTVQ